MPERLDVLSASVTKSDRQALNRHRSFAIWLTGLSGAGKSSVAQALALTLHQEGIRTYVLDGDVLRQGLTRDLGYSAEDRKENLRRVSEVARLLVDAGIVVISALISPYREGRQAARHLFGPHEFVEVFVDCPLEVCEARDPKGLYRQARAGAIPAFTGVSAPYEPPEHPDIRVENAQTPIADGVRQIMDYLYQHHFITRRTAED